MPRKQFKKRPVTVYFSHDELVRLNQTAYEKRTTVSEWIRAVILEYGLIKNLTQSPAVKASEPNDLVKGFLFDVEEPSDGTT